MKHSNLTIDWLDETTLAEVGELPPDVLMMLDRELAAFEQLAKERREVLHGGMLYRYGEKAVADRGGNFGTGHVADGDFDVKVVIDKRVEYDQAKLIEACQALEATGEDATEYVSTEIKVAEAKFKAWPAKVQRLFEPARTTKPAKPKITITQREKAEAA